MNMAAAGRAMGFYALGTRLAISRALGFYLLSAQLQLGRVRQLWMLLAYLLAIALAEVVTAIVDPIAGLGFHLAILLGLLWNGARAQSDAERGMFFCLTLAPVIRMSSLALPLSHLPLLYWYALAAAPVLLAVLGAARNLGYSRQDLALTIAFPRILGEALLLSPVGLLLGTVEYFILQPQPLSRTFAIGDVLPAALVLLVATGFAEELVFRGLLQHAAAGVLGEWPGIVYVTMLFAALHIGYLSVADGLFVFSLGLVLAFVRNRTGSIAGPTLLHGFVNVSLFLTTPLLLAPKL
ncbi:MAG: CPBP family intramembrane metalloprotease [Chloroflexi bacterium]|nr:CPBP family intramembrane metalloprotease [Chloroflexota bacterium]